MPCRAISDSQLKILKVQNAKHIIGTPMAPESPTDINPFMDPETTGEHSGGLQGMALPVGRDASLTMATDSLIVLGSFVTPFTNHR